MKAHFIRNFTLLIVMGMLALLPLAAEATTYTELTSIYESQLQGGGFTTINGVQVEVFESAPGEVEIWVGEQFVGTASASDDDAILAAIATALNIPLVSAGSVAAPTSASTASANLVFNELVVPTVETKQTQQRQQEQRDKRELRAIGTAIRGEWIDIAGENGDVYGFNLGGAYDFDDYTIGVIVPYDHLSFDSFDANRLGMVLFGQYHQALSDKLAMSLTANLNYMFTDYDYKNKSDDSLNTVGIGMSAGFSYVQEKYEAGAGISWQYNKDDVNHVDDEQHLIKMGGNLGVHVSDNMVINTFATWNYDVTDYVYNYGDDNYLEAGLEYRADVSDTWTMNVGYRKVLELDNYESDMLYLGSVWQF